MTWSMRSLHAELTRSDVGGKAVALSRLIRLGFRVPPGFVVPAAAFQEFAEWNSLEDVIERAYSAMNNDCHRACGKARELILTGQTSSVIRRALAVALKNLECHSVAVRSSATSEDGVHDSYAGQFDTHLDVAPDADSVLKAVKACWASLCTDRAVAYCAHKKISRPLGMAVVVQAMIPAEWSGVTFTRHPLLPQAVLVEYAPGTGDLLVSGRTTPAARTYDRSSRRLLEERSLPRGSIANEHSTSTHSDDSHAFNAVMRELVKVCLAIEDAMESPQDVEWSLAEGLIWVLQSRPITEAVR